MNSAQNTLRTKQVVSTDKISRQWHLVDAGGKILGRVAVDVANKLQGRSKTTWSRMQDTGDHVVVINCADIRVTGKKATNKTYYQHTRYPGHLKSKTYQELMEQRPTEVMRKAVFGMLPSTRLRAGMLRRLHLFADDKHTFAKHFTKN